MRAKMALVLHLGGVGEWGRLIWDWSVQARESGDLQSVFFRCCHAAVCLPIPATMMTRTMTRPTMTRRTTTTTTIDVNEACLLVLLRQRLLSTAIIGGIGSP